MLEHIDLINLIAGLWLIINSFIMKTNNIQSTIVFKVVPFLIGLCCLIISLKLYTII